ncbi:MAG TPA: futalosine hydrolase [Longimicrobium sp.]|uniref:futalosine hydrolase n=1 Tax=Longimicrobium sp. TaxID=2029185 RepID=UPI002ED99922
MTESTAPLALVCSVPLECERLRAALEDVEDVLVGRKPGWAGRLDGSDVVLLPGGMGKTNAAHALTALLEAQAVSGVIGFGIGGAYPGSGLEIGSIALATSAVYGDEGVEAPGGWISTEAIGIPLWQAGETRRFNEFPLDAALVESARAALERAGMDVRTGPFVTVSACSGTSVLGQERAARFGAVCEGMEGAALAHVAAVYQVPFLELRGISNHVEDRDMSRWRIREAAEAAQAAVRVMARALTPPR